jgi:methionine aminopeptidase
LWTWDQPVVPLRSECAALHQKQGTYWIKSYQKKAIGIMKPGQTFTIEPMICEGVYNDEHWNDGWTAVTRDGKRSAQFEETLLVTETGIEILTKKLD